MQDQAAYTVGTPYAPKNILAGGTYTMRKVTIASGQNLTLGSVIGTADEAEWVLSLAASVDGSEVPDMVLAQDADASDGAVEAMAYETAQVVGSALVLGAGHTIDSIREGLRLKGITIS